MVLLGETLPDFSCETSTGSIPSFHKWIGDSWAMLCSHPADFTPVCTTELGRLSQLVPEFEKRNVKVLAVSCNDVASHREWIPDINSYANTDVGYPIIADPTRVLAKALGMIPASGGPVDAKGMAMTVRAVFIIGPDKKLKLSLLYPASTGRNFTEIIRVIDSLQVTATQSLATPCDWMQGEECVILPSVSSEAAEEKFPGFKTVDLPSGKPYIRTTVPAAE
ncbi:hypothetical protein NDN08_007435 [Rhodosorus marinus]|uniref:Thioredoxin domain-containing protein n=1 Tax=Rhodosorus marinus TaxID=101924 RepID=A0AAV8V0E3_9RHOD|nr:hypothetical protein NDN08_007435 [Rhodosorus marinus]